MTSATDPLSVRTEVPEPLTVTPFDSPLPADELSDGLVTEGWLTASAIVTLPAPLTASPDNLISPLLDSTVKAAGTCRVGAVDAEASVEPLDTPSCTTDSVACAVVAD